MTPHGQAPVELRLAEVIEAESFVDGAEVADALVRATHQIEHVEHHRTRITSRLEATGRAADHLGQAVSADFADTLRALAGHAAS